MSSFTKNLTLAAVLGMASAIKIQAGDANIWQGKDNEIVFDGCDQSYYMKDNIYEMRLYCDKKIVIKKHEND